MISEKHAKVKMTVQRNQQEKINQQEKLPNLVKIYNKEISKDLLKKVNQTILMYLQVMKRLLNYYVNQITL